MFFVAICNLHLFIFCYCPEKFPEKVHRLFLAVICFLCCSCWCFFCTLFFSHFSHIFLTAGYPMIMLCRPDDAIIYNVRRLFCKSKIEVDKVTHRVFVDLLRHLFFLLSSFAAISGSSSFVSFVIVARFFRSVILVLCSSFVSIVHVPPFLVFFLLTLVVFFFSFRLLYRSISQFNTPANCSFSLSLSATPPLTL